MRTYPIYKVSQNIYEAGLYLYPGQLLIKDFIVGFLKIIFSKMNNRYNLQEITQ